MFPTIPWPPGFFPVRKVACIDEVTAGKVGVMVRREFPCLPANSEMNGISGPMCRDVNPTTFRIATRGLGEGEELKRIGRVRKPTLLLETLDYQ